MKYKLNIADKPISKYKIVQAIGKTIGGGVRGDCFNLLYHLRFFSERLPPNAFTMNVPANGCRMSRIFRITINHVVIYSSRVYI